MNPDDRAALMAAVNRLVAAPDAPQLYDALTDVIPVARRLGVRFTDEQAELNPLIDLACRHPDHYDNVMVLIETKRADAGLAPLDAKRNQVDKFDKTEYMAEFMQRKRVRERKVADVENMMRPPRDQLRGRARLDFMQMQSAKWKAELDERIAQTKAETEGRLRKPQLDAIRRAYWDEVDRYLDELEQYASTEMLKPAHQRKPRPT